MPLDVRNSALPRAVLFDLDGTLLDTIGDIAASMNHALASNGLPTADVAAYSARLGWGLSRLVELSMPPEARSDESLRDRLIQAMREHYQSHLVVHTRPYAGIKELVSELRERGVPLAVLSNKPDSFVTEIIDRTFPGAFQHVQGHRDAEPRKPDPASTWAILRALGVEAEKVVMVGDSEIDVYTARAAGCRPIAVGWGFRDAQALRDAGAERVCYSIGELRDALGLPAESSQQGGES